MRGTVKWFNEQKGYGFIKPEGKGKDVFVHVSNLDGETIRENDQVNFDVTEGVKGPNAVNVRIA